MDKALPSTGGLVERFNSGAEREAEIFRNRVYKSEDRLSVTGKKIYVSQNGDDKNDGASPEKPFRTLERVSKLSDSLNVGDGVFFERGSVFRSDADLELVSGVTYGAYGQGKKPEINGSQKNYADKKLWVLTDNESIWKMSFAKSDAGIIVFDGGNEVGKKQMELSELTENDDFYHDWDENVLYLYCDRGNPGEVFSDIEIGVKIRLFHMQRESKNILIDNIDFRFTGLFGIRGDGAVKNVTVTNCSFAWIGGSLFNNKSNRFGNGIEFADGCEDITVRNCYFDQIFDSGVTFQIGSSLYRNFTVEDCLFEYNGMSGFEWWTKGDEGEKDGLSIDITRIENITIKNNIFRLTGYGWSKATRSPAHIRNGWRKKWYPNMKKFLITDNVFDCVEGEIITPGWTVTPDEYTVSDNTYYQAPIKFQDTDGKADDLSTCESFVKAVEMLDKSPKKIEWIPVL